jgi:hypothetical protein
MHKLHEHFYKLCFIALLVCGAWLCSASAQESNPNQNNPDNAQTGVAQGVLIGKGKGWIVVRVEDKKSGRVQNVRLSPVWVGGLPRQGGGPDKRMLAIFEQLKVGDNLKFSWLRDGKNLYVTSIQVLPPQDEEGTE